MRDINLIYNMKGTKAIGNYGQSELQSGRFTDDS